MQSHMSMRGRFVLFALAALMAVSLPAQATEPEADGLGPFVDTDGSVFEMPVAALWHAGVTSGCAEWKFCPDSAITREQAAAFLVRALGLETGGADRFIDTSPSPFRAEIGVLATAGITQGCGLERFCPADPVTRDEVASFLVRALDLPPTTADPFTDDDQNVHEADIGALAASGITMGCGQFRFCPDEPVTRAELAAFLVRALELPTPDELPVIPEDVRQGYLAELATPPWPIGPGAEGWRPLLSQYFRPGDVDRAVRIVACESHGDPDARNLSSGASGLFQHMPRYWSERSAAAGFAGHSVFDPVANVAVAAWLVYDYPGGGWSHWVCRG